MAHQYLAYAFFAAALLLGGWGYSNRARRTTLWVGALAACCAGASAYSDSFWAAVLFGTVALWGTIGGLNIADNSWRMRGGLIATVFVVGLISLWPTASAMSGGKIPLPEFVKERVSFKLVAGLDLRGGLRLVYTVDVAEAIRDRRDRRYENMRVELAKIFDLHEGDDTPDEKVYAQLREKVDLHPSPTLSNTILLKLKDGVDAAKIDAKFLDQFSGDLGFSRSDNQREYTFTLKKESESELRNTAVAQAKEIILRRVDELGLREASVSTRDEDIIVEVPGQDESTFNEIRDIISQTASLEFKLLDDDTDFFGAMQRDPNAQLPEGISLQAETVSVGEDANGDIQRKQTSYAVIEAKKDEALKDTLARFKQWTATLEMPPDRELGYELVRSIDPDTNVESETGWRTYLLKSRAEITGDMIRDAQAVPDTGTSSLGGWYVALNFTDAGGSIFERITGANIKRRFAIILDERIESAPVIQARIAGGRASITMGSGDPAQQLADSRKLELVLRSGALPAPITPSNEQHIGPSLGAASINLAVKGALFSSIIVLAFMYLYYRGAGIIANLAVLFNLLMQLAVLATFNASMTLPGIAGLALTIGMGVDANVLINERVREELREGRSARAAVDIGFSRAFGAILDGHVTTLISAIVLAQFGTGPIKGFAVTLMVGVTTSMFTGVVVSRWLFDFWIRNMDRNAKLNMG